MSGEKQDTDEEIEKMIWRLLNNHTAKHLCREAGGMLERLWNRRAIPDDVREAAERIEGRRYLGGEREDDATTVARHILGAKHD